MKRLLTLSGLLALGVTAQASQLWHNGEANGLSSPTGLETVERSAGGWYSQLTAPNSLLGSSVNDASFRIGDDFTVGGGGWEVSTIQVFAYQTNETALTLTGGTLEVRSGAVDGSVVATGTFASAFLTDIYRTGTTLTDVRRVQSVIFDLAGATLAAGDYWITYGVSGSGASGPWNPVLTAPGSADPLAGANAQQFSVAAGTWSAIADGGSGNAHDVPFIIEGEAVPEPATMTLLGLGALAAFRRKKARKA